MLLTDLAYPAAWRDEAAAVAGALKRYDRYIVCGHAHLDGDALASVTAAGFLLRALGREFVLYSPYGVPAYLEFVERPASVYTSLARLPFTPQCVLALDLGTPSRLGEELGALLPSLACINVDHHPGPGMGTAANMIHPEAAATAQLLASVIHASGADFTPAMASALMTGLITDTGGFRHSNTDPGVLALAAELSLRGADIHAIRDCLDKTWTIPRFRLWSRLSAKVSTAAAGAVAICSCTSGDLGSTTTTQEDCEGFVERMLSLKGVRIAALLKEQEPGKTRFSLRAAGDSDVAAIAAVFGGGGHVKAAGGTIALPADEAEKELLAAILRTAPKPL